MNSNEYANNSGLMQWLHASGGAPQIPDEANIYGWLIGSWHLQISNYAGTDVAALGIEGEVHFGWVLEGRAIQDVWIMPRPADRSPDQAPTKNMYGTTLRVWDPGIQAWRITWINPAANHHEEQIGRRIGKEIVQIGTRSNGTPTRWRYTEMTPDAFIWLGEALNPDGQTWKLEARFIARRVKQEI